MDLNFSLFKYYLSGSILFLIIIFCGEFFFSLNFKKKNKFFLRSALSLLAVILISSGLSFPYFIVEQALNNIYFTNITAFFLYLIMFLLSVFAMTFCYKERFTACLVSGVMAYVSQNIYYNLYSIANAFGLENKIYNSAGEWAGFTILVLIQIGMAFLVQVIIYFSLIKNVKRYSPDDITKKNAKLISIATIIVVLLMNALFNVCSVDNALTKVFCRALLLICCIFMLLLYVKILEIGKTVKNLEMLSQLNVLERKNYEKIKDSISMINIKYHDLKHFIEVEKNNNGKLNTDELEKIVKVYDETIKTGNEVIDVILSEKKFYCSSHDITLKISADATGLDFINTTDLCSLFGNMMENAIEAVVKIEEKEKKNINVIIRHVAGQIFLCVENNCLNDFTIKEGLPISTKKDSNNHGYGLKSIKMIVEKYDGTFTFENKDDTFKVCIFFPLHS